MVRLRITEFTRKSKANMRRAVLSTPWGDYMRDGDMIHVTTAALARCRSKR